MTELAALPVGRPRRLVYFGTPEMAVAPLEALVGNGFEVALVVTSADKRRGRGSATTPSPVKQAATRLGLVVSNEMGDALDVGADLGVVVAFGQLIKPAIIAELAFVNLHFSLLPRWRGAAPVERALLAGDTTTGVCLMQLDEGLDTGPILDVHVVPIGPRQTAAELRHELVSVGSRQLVAALEHGLGPGVAQVGEPTYAKKLNPSEFAIDWTRPAAEVDRLLRLGVAWTTFRGRRLKIVAGRPSAGSGRPGSFIGPSTVACGIGAIDLERVQPEGRPPMGTAAWANGARPELGERFASPVGR